tara:strand:- start:570 stop:1271 length:702 start_codon:yes stop_codon:yes gene_type:complete
MEFENTRIPDIEKPIIIAAMQDMGNVGSIVVNFINKSLGTVQFRNVRSTKPSFVYDKGGYIDIPEERWEFRFAKDFIVFGGGRGQPQDNQELNELCQDVINIAKQYDAKFIYTVGGYHTTRKFGKSPTTYVTTTSQELFKLVQKLGIETTPTESVITGFNGLILGYAKLNEINGIGLYGELLEPRIPQYRAAKTILETLEKLTYQKLGDLNELKMKAEAIENRFKSDKYTNDI